jgi:hypothetical protein
MVRWRKWRSWLAVGTLFVPQIAHGYCRSTTKEPKSTCPEVCSLEGTPLRWANPKLVFSLNERGFPTLGMDQLREVVTKSFAVWEGVTCDGKRVDYDFELAANATSDSAMHLDGGVPNRSVLVYEDEETWADNDHSPVAFAVTTIAFSPRTGFISEADIEFNGGMPTWAVCPAAGCSDGDGHTDLPNVLIHELGHTLGLSHSGEEGSTMECAANPGDTNKRDLSPDDVTAICLTYPPGETFLTHAESVEGVTCSVRPGVATRGASRQLSWVFALYATARLVRRARRRRQRSLARRAFALHVGRE